MFEEKIQGINSRLTTRKYSDGIFSPDFIKRSMVDGHKRGVFIN